MNQPDNLMSMGIDVLDRIEKIEKLQNEVKKILDLNERVKERNVFTIEQVIQYANHISGTVARQPEYPRMKQTHPYPYHIKVPNLFNYDLLENAGWNRENQVEPVIENDIEKEQHVIVSDDDDDEKSELMMSEDDDSSDII